MKSTTSNKYTRFVLYLVVVVLINAVGMNLFFRVDLTANGLYSLSPVSRNVVSNLSEPLTIHVFFSRNLPAPHNNTRRYLEDLLKEYSVWGNRNFNYRFHDIDAEAGTPGGAGTPESYGIYPLQLQYLKNDEIKLLKAYMGMALIYGDMVEQIQSITSTDGLEYQITTAIQKMNNKIGALMRLENPIQVKLILSSSLQAVAPFMKLPGLMELPEKVKKSVADMSARFYNKLEFSYVDPTRNPSIAPTLQHYRLLKLSWPALRDAFGKEIPAGSGVAGLVVEHGDESREYQLIEAMNIPLIGTQYRLVKPDRLQKSIEQGVESLLDINTDLGYLADHGTLTLFDPMSAMQGGDNPNTISNFNSLVGKSYSLKSVNLKKDGLTGGFDTLVIAGPKKEFTDYELFQIDQFLMRGGNLAVFIDPYNEIMPQNNQNFMNRNQGPVYLPLNTGLEKLLSHYGVTVEKAYVMDEKCFRRTVEEQYGGGEQVFYFAPEIQQEYINHDLPFMRNLNRLIMLKAAPLRLDEDGLKKNKVKGIQLFTSSPDAWKMSGRINLNPYMISKPRDPSKLSRFPLAVMLQGEFNSYFAGKPVPAAPAPDTDKEKAPAEKPAGKKPDSSPDLSSIQNSGRVITHGKAARILVIGTSDILRNNIMDNRGEGQNSIFILNLLDHLNNRDSIAAMRSKQQTVALLKASRTTEGAKAFVKTFNILGLPLLVVLAGLGVWWRRNRRRKRIRMAYSPETQKGDKA